MAGQCTKPIILVTLLAITCLSVLILLNNASTQPPFTARVQLQPQQLRTRRRPEASASSLALAQVGAATSRAPSPPAESPCCTTGPTHSTAFSMRPLQPTAAAALPPSPKPVAQACSAISALLVKPAGMVDYTSSSATLHSFMYKVGAAVYVANKPMQLPGQKAYPRWVALPGQFAVDGCALSVPIWTGSARFHMDSRAMEEPALRLAAGSWPVRSVMQISAGMLWGSTSYEENFEHFFDQTAPLLLNFLALKARSPDAKLVVPQFRWNQMYAQVMQLFGLSEKSDLVTPGDDTLVLANELDIPPFPQLQTLDPAVMAFRAALRKHAMAAANCVAPGTGKLLLLRDGGGSNNNFAGKGRQIMNVDQLKGWATKAGADVMTFSALSIVEKAAALCKYRCVVTQTGANGVNFVFGGGVQRIIWIKGVHDAAFYQMKYLSKLSPALTSAYAASSWTGRAQQERITVTADPFAMC